MKETDSGMSIQMCEGNHRVWIEQESIHMKAVNPYGAPLELTADEARILTELLRDLANKMRD